MQASQLAKHVDFFSFGTNDLTQMCLGFSRDDAEAKFLPTYLKEGVLTAGEEGSLHGGWVRMWVRVRA